MFPEVSRPNPPRRPRRYALDGVADDSAMLVLLLIVFLLICAVALIVIGAVPLPGL